MQSPILCLDELGYVLPSKNKPMPSFRSSPTTEVATTLVTTNLIPSDWGKIFDAVTATPSSTAQYEWKVYYL